ncbi:MULTISPECIES: phosphate acetyltransferase [unclassified Streptococcus]|uniref:phosphate acetyltransferase n=1 Tax=unclassified Streptococcus TaxID=2608887 RepID=UPI0011B4CEE6|nr:MULTISPECIES: phosphate acetyltransferase [unclassified Streptococcus]TWS95610.1 phosphate acetyltransferase [Streptococcus sp. sy018]TWT16730.1 phosphate acetyltransferase [Streptococcus sp. sy010]
MIMASLFETLKEKIVGKNIKIVFPEGNDLRVVTAAGRLKAEGLLEPIVLGNTSDVEKLLAEAGYEQSNVTIIDPENYDQLAVMKEMFLDLRKGKVEPEQADQLLKDVNYFGVMLVQMGLAAGMVSGAIHSTADTVRPALQIIKTKPGVSRTSGIFIMNRDSTNERLVFGDCAINIEPNAQELAEIAVNTAETAKIFAIDPYVAMLSFSTMGSGKSPNVDKVVEATRLAKEMAPNLKLDGELQFDAAYVAATAKIKAPDSQVAGQANTFIFPDLQSGNIGYKIAERLGSFEAIGPILQGLNKPVNDLSRGSNAEDIYKLGIITAAQALDN